MAEGTADVGKSPDDWSFLVRQKTGEKKGKYAKYEENRSERKLIQSWKKGRPWLEFEGSSSMVCTWCTEHAGKGNDKFVWTSGKLETLKLHACTKTHVKCATIVASLLAPVGTTKAEKIIETLNQATMDKLMILFRNAHALALAGRPFADFVWLAKLDEKKGLAVGKTYITDKKASEFTNFIAAIEIEKLKKTLTAAKFISILSDGSTSCSIAEKEIVYLRVCMNGIVKVPYINCIHVAKGNAVGIVDAMTKSVEKIGIPWTEFTEKLVGMGSDGASVMTGRQNGVAAILRRQQPAMVAVHCYAHKLELAFKDATRGVAIDNKVSICLLQGLYYFYHNSPLNRSNLKASCATLGLKVLMPTRIGGTRWVGHLLRALVNFMKAYPAIRQHLEQVVQPTERITAGTSGKAKGILKLIRDTDIILYCHFLADVVTVLSRLSKHFQRTNCSAADIHGALDETINLLTRFETKDGPYLTAGKAVAGLSDEWVASQRNGQTFVAARKSLINGLVTKLRHRFDLVDVIRAMKIANFTVWPLAEDVDDVEAFGDDCLPVLLENYSTILEKSGVDAVEASLEWTALKTKIYSGWPDKVKSLTVEKVNQMFADQGFSNILSLFDLILTIPGSSAECERGFRYMKAFHTDSRSSLGDQGLSDQLMIKMHSASVEMFDPLPAIHLWNSGGQRSRRPLFADKGDRAKLEDANAALATELSINIEKTETDSDCETDEEYNETVVQEVMSEEGVM